MKLRSGLILLAILLVGLFLRLCHLGDESIWYDEAVSIKWASLNLFQIVTRASNDVHSPLYFFLLQFWVDLFGSSEFSTRLPSVIYGCLTIVMTYKVGSLIFDEETGILGALILALSTFHIYYSQEARMYSLMPLLTLLSIYFFIKFLRGGGLLASIGYVLSSILLLYTHIYGLFIIIAQNIYVFTIILLLKNDYKPNFKKWFQLQVVLIVLFTPWIGVLIKQILRVQSGAYIGWIPAPSINTLVKSFNLYSGGTSLLLLFLALSFFSIINYKKVRGNLDWRDLFKSIKSGNCSVRLSNVNGKVLLLIWLLTPIILPFLISKVSTPIYWYRFTIGASLAFYILVANGIRNLKAKYLKFAIISIIIFGSLTTVWGYHSELNKPRWREVASQVDKDAKPGDLLLFNARFNRVPFDYYSQRSDLIKRPFPEKTRYVNEENIKELGKIIEGHNRVWVILNFSGDSKGLIKKTLSKTYNLSYHREYIYTSFSSGNKSSTEVILFEKK